MLMDAARSRQQAFELLYANHSWGGVSKSGPGSDPIHTSEYVRFLQHWLTNHPDVRTIVEVGCGDWSTTRRIQFRPDHEYLGLDIVDDLVDENRRRYETERIRFLRRDFVDKPPPGADVLIAKDVLQHLSNASITTFLQRSLNRYKFAIFTNDVAKTEYIRLPFGLKYPRTMDQINRNIQDGESRPLRIGAPPFNLDIAEQALYRVNLQCEPRQIVYTKQIVVWER
jgi:hypothetical protein